MVRWDCPPRCLSPHVLPTRSHYETLTWHLPNGDEKARVLKWTCDCGPTLYELCQVGELRLIRRTERVPGEPAIDESDRWQAPEADAMWIALLHGLVR
ncbi:hypothetical protein ACFQVD_21605 [Streptosporangium amethystogenes subsp. fukuiense]|uniref:Acetone carboxylase n=1 Tax=Streptosporangium amethystogenes subsp. fukuiense TaxID=698418 RepID=A0ABW2T3Z6_9ACTN